jgi:hypothetical protein
MTMLAIAKITNCFETFNNQLENLLQRLIKGKCDLLERNVDKNLITKIEHYFEGLRLPMPEEGQ